MDNESKWYVFANITICVTLVYILAKTVGLLFASSADQSAGLLFSVVCFILSIGYLARDAYYEFAGYPHSTT